MEVEGSNRMFVDGNGDLRAQAQVTSAGLAGAFDILLNMRLQRLGFGMRLGLGLGGR